MRLLQRLPRLVVLGLRAGNRLALRVESFGGPGHGRARHLELRRQRHALLPQPGHVQFRLQLDRLCLQLPDLRLLQLEGAAGGLQRPAGLKGGLHGGAQRTRRVRFDHLSLARQCALLGCMLHTRRLVLVLKHVDSIDGCVEGLDSLLHFLWVHIVAQLLAKLACLVALGALLRLRGLLRRGLRGVVHHLFLLS